MQGEGLSQVQEYRRESTVTSRTAVAPAVQHSPRRWLVLALLFTITVINFVDRQTLSVLAPVLRQAFHLSNAAYGRIVAALQFGMMSGEFPMGWFMDRWGARIGMSFAVLWWSGATGAQVFANNGLKFGITRFWMGTGECGNYSGGIKTVTQLFVRRERTLAIGIFNSGSMVGATLAPPLIVYLLHRFGFRAAFLVPAVAGLLWVPLWWAVRGRDERQAYVAEQEAAHDPLRRLLTEPSVWAVMLCRFFVGPVIQFYWYWIPNYLYSVRHMSMTQIGALAWLPFFLGDLGGVAGGATAGALERAGMRTVNVRRVTMYGGAVLCGASFFVPYLPHMSAAMIMIGVAVLGHNFLSANMYGAITDLFPDHRIGRVTGLTGVAGGLSGLMFPLLTGVLVDRVSYTPVFLLIALMPLVGTVLLFLLGKGYRRPSLRESRIDI